MIRDGLCRNCVSEFAYEAKGGKHRPLCQRCERSYKWCPSCGYALSRVGFTPDARNRDGLEGCCRQCKARQFQKRHVPGYGHNPRKDRAAKLLSRYGLSQSGWDEMVVAQGGRCAICSTTTPDLHIDHCHESGQVRGLLCPPCNKGLGHFRDDVDRMRSAIDYLLTPGLVVQVGRTEG